MDKCVTLNNKSYDFHSIMFYPGSLEDKVDTFL